MPESWVAVNDGVMGGVSQGEMVETQSGLRFQGELSLENNGGFASVRRSLENSCGSTYAVALRLRGDGRSYQLRTKTDRDRDGVSWRVIFETTGSWQTVELKFEEFEAVYRGQHVKDAGTLDPAQIRQLGFLIADGKTGPFQLDIADIQFLAQ